MNPTAPSVRRAAVTTSSCSGSGGELRDELGERLAEVAQQRHAGGREHGVVEHAVGRARRGPGRLEVGRRDRPHHLGVAAGGGDDVADELVPADRALVGGVVDAADPPVAQATQQRGEVGGERRVAVLVVDERQRGPLVA